MKRNKSSSSTGSAGMADGVRPTSPGPIEVGFLPMPRDPRLPSSLLLQCCPWELLFPGQCAACLMGVTSPFNWGAQLGSTWLLLFSLLFERCSLPGGRSCWALPTQCSQEPVAPTLWPWEARPLW